MCPVCIGGVAWLITSGVSGLSATAGGVIIARDKKIVAKISSLWKHGPREPLTARLKASEPKNEYR